MDKILVTGDLFIFPEHEQKLREFGYEVERVAGNLTEDELIKSVKGKVGYILGGIERVTDKVIESADELKAIVFTGTDHKEFIPGHKLATKKGIHISETPGANVFAVAEYTVSAILAMIRNLFDLTRVGKKNFQTTKSLKSLTVGIIGMGTVGKIVTKMLSSFGIEKIIYFSPNKKNDISAEYKTLEDVFRESDVVSLHTSTEAGFGFVDKSKLSLMKDGSLLVNCSFTGAINSDDLFEELKSGRLRAFQDDPIDEKFDKLPVYNWMCSNMQSAYNTEEANKTVSDMVTHSMINLLETGDDKYKAN